MKKPTQSRAALESIARSHKVDQQVFLIGIRSFFRDSMGVPGKGDRGIYDDAIFLVTPTSVLAFNANTDPSVRRPGIASLIPGVHPYRKGNHGISKPGGGYPAFRPATPGEKLPVTRDGSQALTTGVAINIHRGGYKSTSSEGCQTIYPTQWEKFKSAVDKAMDNNGLKTINYILIEKPDL